MSSPTNPTCPTGCASIVPGVAFSNCDPKIYFGEIRKIYVASGDADDFTDIESLAEWTARLAQTGGNYASIRELTVSGDQPLPDAGEIEISNKRKVYPPKKWVLNFDIDDLTDLNYEFARTTGCNQRVKVWYATDDHIYGGAVGILGDLVINPMIERGNQSVQKMTGSFTWEYKFAPERNDSPWAV